MATTANMYKLKPVFKCPKLFIWPTSLYKLKNLQVVHVRNTTSSMAELTSEDINITSTQIDENIILFKQENLLTELELFQKELAAFKNTLNKNDSPDVIVSNNLETVTIKSINSSVLLPDNFVDLDVVIKADPKYPPYNLLSLIELWDCKPINLSIHVHSSIQYLTEDISVLKKFESFRFPNKCLNIYFIWKNVGEDCQLILSPSKNEILGEANILNFLNKYLDINDDLKKTYIDKILNVVYHLRRATKTEEYDLLKQLEINVQNHDWLSRNEKPTIADIAAWSALRKINETDLPENLKSWFNKCSDFVK